MIKYILSAILFGFSLAGFIAWLLFFISEIIGVNPDMSIIDIYILGIVSIIGILYSLGCKKRVEKD